MCRPIAPSLVALLALLLVGCSGPAPTPPPDREPTPPDDERLRPLYDLIVNAPGDVIIYRLDAATEAFFDDEANADQSRWVGVDQPDGAVGMTDRPNAAGWSHVRVPAAELADLAHFVGADHLSAEDTDFGKHGFLVEYLDGDRPIARLDFHTAGGAPEAVFAIIPGQWPDDDGAMMLRFTGNGWASWRTVLHRVWTARHDKD